MTALEDDPMCDKKFPKKITFEDISAAAFRIKRDIVQTPCVKSRLIIPQFEELYMKCEFMQYTGSVKDRGARNSLMLLNPPNKIKGVITASLGNHAKALSYHGDKMKIPVTVVMPISAPLVKIKRCEEYGANVIVYGQNMTEARNHAMEICKKESLTYLNGRDHPDIIAGQGTIGLEILEQVPDVEVVLVPCGGGGLLAGIITAIKHLAPEVLVYGVGTTQCNCMMEALQKGEPVHQEIATTIADGLAANSAGYNSFFNIKSVIDKMIIVTEDWTAESILRIMELEKYMVEGAGAVGVAAVLAGLVPELAGKKIVCIMSGGNIDTSTLRQCLERGLRLEHRLATFKVIVGDRPGSMAELCSIIGSAGGHIKQITNDHSLHRGNIFETRVTVECELRGDVQLLELRNLIEDKYKDAVFFPMDHTKRDHLGKPIEEADNPNKKLVLGLSSS